MKLEPYYSLPTSGARCVMPFVINEQQYLALPQLAEDLPNSQANISGGRSDTHSNIYIWNGAGFELFQNLPVHGGEHIDFAIINNTPMLAVANIRQGTNPDFNMNVDSQIFAWDGYKFNLAQAIPSNAAKSTCFFQIDKKWFLGLSEGVSGSAASSNNPDNSHLYEWDGQKFSLYQSLPGLWGYDLSFFSMGTSHYLALADNITGSVIYIWRNNKFEKLQEFDRKGGGRDFCHFSINGEYYLALANLLGSSHLYHWDGNEFKKHQIFERSGARHFHFKSILGKCYLFQTNFITGTRDAPISKQNSEVHYWDKDKFVSVTTYLTFGGTSSNTLMLNDEYYLAVSNSLSEDIRFRVDSVIYKINF